MGWLLIAEHFRTAVSALCERAVGVVGVVGLTVSAFKFCGRRRLLFRLAVTLAACLRDGGRCIHDVITTAPFSDHCKLLQNACAGVPT